MFFWWCLQIVTTKNVFVCLLDSKRWYRSQLLGRSSSERKFVFFRYISEAHNTDQMDKSYICLVLLVIYFATSATGKPIKDNEQKEVEKTKVCKELCGLCGCTGFYCGDECICECNKQSDEGIFKIFILFLCKLMFVDSVQT